GKPKNHHVTVSFIANDGSRFAVTRSRDHGVDVEPGEIAARLCRPGGLSSESLETLIRTTLIRDELIAALSLDLPGQARFAAVREAVGSMTGRNYSNRTDAILNAAHTALGEEQER